MSRDLATEEALVTRPVIAVNKIGRTFGSVLALQDVTCSVYAGRVLCVLGDNGAGKSTLIRILAGAHQHTSGEFTVGGEDVVFTSPRDALAAGIATVYQTLATVPLMSVWRNFFLGSEITRGVGIFRRLDVKKMRTITKEQLHKMGIDLRDVDQPIGTLSGGERQSVAIARAVYFGAKVLILDEPTSALGVKQAGIVLKYIARARSQGLGVVFISHNPRHAYAIGDDFLILRRGRSVGYFRKEDLELEQLSHLMGGGDELNDISREIEEMR